MVKARKLAYHEETMKLPGERDNAGNSGRQGRPRTVWMDNIKTWTGLSVEESIKMTKGRDKWRKYVCGVVNPRIDDGSLGAVQAAKLVAGQRKVMAAGFMNLQADCQEPGSYAWVYK